MKILEFDITNPRLSEIYGARDDIINGGLIKLELTIVIDVPLTRSRAWAQKGELISQNCGTCYATRRPGPKLFPPGPFFPLGNN